MITTSGREQTINSLPDRSGQTMNANPQTNNNPTTGNEDNQVDLAKEEKLAYKTFDSRNQDLNLSKQLQ
jgi:hypothetical protein